MASLLERWIGNGRAGRHYTQSLGSAVLGLWEGVLGLYCTRTVTPFPALYIPGIDRFLGA
jgi:hypothetical protein